MYRLGIHSKYVTVDVARNRGDKVDCHWGRHTQTSRGLLRPRAQSRASNVRPTAIVSTLKISVHALWAAAKGVLLIQRKRELGPVELFPGAPEILTAAR